MYLVMEVKVLLFLLTTTCDVDYKRMILLNERTVIYFSVRSLCGYSSS